MEKPEHLFQAIHQAGARAAELLAGHEPLPLGDDVERELRKLRRCAADSGETTS